MSRFTDYCDTKRNQFTNTGHHFDASELAPQFVDAFNGGAGFRVLVDFGYADEKPVWGFVGITTGWKPCFLLMRRRGQIGSSECLNTSHKIIRTKWIKA